MSELVDSDDVQDMSIEQSSICDSEAARTPLSDSRCESNILNAESIVDQQASSHRGLNPSDEREVARKYPLSDVGCDSDALNVNIDVVGEIPRHPDPAQRMHVKWHVIHVMTTSCPMTRHRMSIVTSALVYSKLRSMMVSLRQIRITHLVLCHKVMMTISCIHSTTE